MKYKKEIFAFGIALIALSLILILNKTVSDTFTEYSLWHNDQKVLTLEIADTKKLRTEGLSGRERLEEGRGLLFIFDSEDKHGIWMKDMNFSIDVIWLDKDFEVINFKKSLSPDTYPRIFQPTKPALYVLETNVGLIDSLNIKIGQELDIRSQIVPKEN